MAEAASCAELDKSELELPPEHAVILAALHEQQAKHEQTVQRMLEEQLRLIEQKLSGGNSQSDWCQRNGKTPILRKGVSKVGSDMKVSVSKPEFFSTQAQCRRLSCESVAAVPEAEAPDGSDEGCSSSEPEETPSEEPAPGQKPSSVWYPADLLPFTWNWRHIPWMLKVDSVARDSVCEGVEEGPHKGRSRCRWLYYPGHLSRVVTRSPFFEYAVELLIFANGIVLGVQQDKLVRNVGGALDPVFFNLDVFFAVAFALELFIRILASGTSFMSVWNKDIMWNVFDTCLVTSATIELYMKSTNTESVVDASTARLLRLLRLVRVVRVIRVMRFFKDLRVMVLSIMGSLRPLAFALLLLGILIYVVAVCVVQFVSEELASLSKLEGGREQPSFVALVDAYGSLPRATYTLFMSISGGVSWGEACGPLLDISPILGLCFIMYVAFSDLCVLNIITGIFVEEATTKTAEDEENMLIHETQRRRRFVAEAKRFFEEADKDGSGELSWPEFQERLEHMRMQKLMENLGIDVVACGARNVFELFDFDGNGAIAISEFTSGLQQLRGNARSIDVAGLRYEQKRLRKEVDALTTSCQEILKAVSGRPLTPLPPSPCTDTQAHAPDPDGAAGPPSKPAAAAAVGASARLVRSGSGSSCWDV